MSHSKEIISYMNRLGSEAKEASSVLAQASIEQRNASLDFIAEAIELNRDKILSTNQKDLELAKQKSIGSALIDRLELNDNRIDSMISGLKIVSDLPDPVGEITDLDPTPSGIEVKKMRVPLGVVGIIYESRPNVTADAAALCLKSGNSCLLRGGSEAILSNKIIWSCLQEGLNKSGLPKECVQLVETTDREAVKTLLHLDEYLDVVIPRGGKGLVQLISDESRIPVIKHLDGICHVFIDKDADHQKAQDIAFNAKTYRYGICGAMETLLIHSEIADSLLPSLTRRFESEGVELRGCDKTLEISEMVAANEEDWSTEYLDAIISVKLVNGVEQAVSHINKYSSQHTETIITENEETASYFLRNVDSAIVIKNASTQFADGGEFGMGAEIGISTGRLHARGPVGANQLTSFKYIVNGDGQIRPN